MLGKLVRTNIWIDNTRSLRLSNIVSGLPVRLLVSQAALPLALAEVSAQGIPATERLPAPPNHGDAVEIKGLPSPHVCYCFDTVLARAHVLEGDSAAHPERVLCLARVCVRADVPLQVGLAVADLDVWAVGALPGIEVGVSGLGNGLRAGLGGGDCSIASGAYDNIRHRSWRDGWFSGSGSEGGDRREYGYV